MKLFTKSFIFVLFIMALLTEAAAQAPSFTWTKKAGGTGRDQGYALTTDSKGNIYVTGEFTNTGTFAPGVSLVSAGNVDYFLAKYDSLGNAIWGKKGGGTLTDRGYGVVIGKDGNPVVTGHYYGQSTFDTVTVTSAGNLDMFLIKYDTSGKMLWFREGKSVSQTSPRGITVDKDGNYIITGYFGTVGTLTAVFDNVTLTSNGQRDIFLLKYNQDGVIQWGVSAGSKNIGEEGKDVTCDAAGNIYITGSFMDSAYFGNTTLVGKGGTDMFLAKYSPAGKLVWAKSAGGLKDDEGDGIALDGLGNVYISGRFDSAAVFGTTSVLGNGTYEAFIAKYDTSGNMQWIRTGGGTSFDYMNSVVCDQTGVIGMGTFITSATFSGTQLTSAGLDDIYYIKYKANGDLSWIKTGGGAEKEIASKLILDKSGNIFSTGCYRATSTFGSDILTTYGIEDVFLTKFTGAGVIPVELTTFTAKAKDNSVQLNWATATETNNSGFEIERSADNKIFDKIGFIAGKGTTTEKQSYTYLDNKISASKYYYRLKQIDLDGKTNYSSVAYAELTQPNEFKLLQNYPNPFNPSTVISYKLPAESKVILKVYNILGKEVASLINGQQAAGWYNVKFDAASHSLSSGVYYYRLQVKNIMGSFNETKKMILNK